MVHRLVASDNDNAWIPRLGDILGGCTQQLLLAEDSLGQTPVGLLTLRKDSPELISSLLSAAEDADACLLHPYGNAMGSCKGWLPLHTAASLRSTSFCKALLSQARAPQSILKAGIPWGGSKGCIALHLPCATGNLAMAKFLLEEAEDPGALLLVAGDSAMVGCTDLLPLNMAASMGHEEVVRLFLRTAADPKALLGMKDSKSRTPLDIAKERGHSALLPLLEP